jgi:small conductance mechanosensitive channel
VTEIGSRTTVLETNDGIAVHIPNIEVADKVIEVYSAYESRKAQFSLNVDYATDLASLTTRLVKAVSAVDDVEAEPAPAVQAIGYDGTAIALSISFWYASLIACGGSLDCVT